MTHARFIPLFKLAVVATCCLAWSSSTVFADVFGTGGDQFTIDFVAIGDPGNADDRTGSPNPAGRVDYTYRMGRYEVSEDMIAKANTAGSLGLAFDARGLNKPATSVSWNEAARFVNWLNTITNYQAAYKFTTQPGDTGYNANENISMWQAGDQGFNSTNPYRNSRARYFLPSMDEWYKSAYYDPNANGGAGGYWDYPTGSDTTPIAVAGGTTSGTAVYNGQMGPADIMDAGGLSPYGVMGLGGNVFEWEETAFDLLNNSGSDVRGLRGGSWSNISQSMTALVRFNSDPSIEAGDVGFRVASIPEPCSLVLGVLGAIGVLLRRRR